MGIEILEGIMRLIGIDFVKPQSILGKDVYDRKLNRLVRAGAKVSERLINNLKESGMRYLYIEDEISKGIEIESIIDDTVKLKAVNILSDIISPDFRNKSVDPSLIQELNKIIDDIVDASNTYRDRLYFTTELLGSDMYTYNHSIEVAVLSVLIANSMGFNQVMMHRIGLGAILGDIGKARVPEEILYKKGKLTPDEFNSLKAHTIHGFNMLKECMELTPTTRQIVALHHEKLDGSGYPNGFSGDQIPMTVRIVTMCDIFNAVISDRVYNSRKSIDDALELLRIASVTKLDRDVLLHLNQVVAIYPPGTLVRLTDDRIAMIVKTRKNMPTRPIVRIIEGGTVVGEVDLMDELTVFIKESISNYGHTS